ncbi:MAG: 1-deoxy-D-xylulose-5-phosphate reductoisomerase [Leptospiraceae bacterium]|nr:1-deoxy-D-xylulose-5-phosphate reductoisomerase [Leptospiraceae bacterium]
MRTEANKAGIGNLLNVERARPTRSLILLGASGSVGSSCLRFIENQSDIRPVAVSVHRNVECVRAILNRHRTRRVCISCEQTYRESAGDLRSRYPDTLFYGGPEGMLDMIAAAHADGADTVLTAVVGAAGIRATILALNLGLKIALANKETMVTAGPAIANLIRSKLSDSADPTGAPVILPVDSEHNAVFQLLAGLRDDHIRRVILTASGGPFRDRPVEELPFVTREEVLNHPTWSMGAKITVDSAGMINKGLEIIEAHYLFSLPYDQLDVLIHRHSLIHAMIETRDGAYLMSGSRPHMVFPIAHALMYPEPVTNAHSFAGPPQQWPSIEFDAVASDKYPGYRLCVAAGRRGGTAPAILNAANEVAVELFLNGELRFVDIPVLIESVLEQSTIVDEQDLEVFLAADQEARERAAVGLAAARGAG